MSQIESTVKTENQKVLLSNGGNSINVLFWTSAPRSFFRLLSRVQKVNKLQFGAKKGALYGQKNEFFKSNMDVLTVLSIWGHWLDRDIMYVLNGLFRYKKLMVDIQANVAC